MKDDSKFADMSSIVRILNSFNAKIELCAPTILFKTDKKGFAQALLDFSKIYYPLIRVKLHECGDEEHAFRGYYILQSILDPRFHTEACRALYELLEKYESV